MKNCDWCHDPLTVEIWKDEMQKLKGVRAYGEFHPTCVDDILETPADEVALRLKAEA